MFFVITTAHPKEIRPVITLCLHTVTRWAHEMSRFLSSFPACRLRRASEIGARPAMQSDRSDAIQVAIVTSHVMNRNEFATVDTLNIS